MAANEYPGPVVSAGWLARHLDDPSIRIVDATIHLPDLKRDAHGEYREAHIPGAAFFDFMRVSDQGNPLPRHFPDRATFAREIGHLGIGNDTHVVAYDTPGLYSAARVWWLFRQYGYDRVSIVDGGFKDWHAAGLPVATGEVVPEPKSFVPGTERNLLARWQDVLAASCQHSCTGSAQILDARAGGHFAGTETNRYPGTKSGHIPGSRNLYWAQLLDPETRRLLPAGELKARFMAAGIDYRRPAILTCGSGVTACILALGLHLSGMDDWRVFDGSWDEWGRRADLPIDMGVPA